MHRRVRPGVAAGLVAMALLVPARAEAAPASVADPAGDTVTATIEDPISAPRADIVATAAESRPEGLAFSVRVAEAVDPLADPNWKGEFVDSYVTWLFDSDGDGEEDFESEYYYDAELGKIVADLIYSNPGSLPDGCDPAASYSPEAGYTIVADPKCFLGVDSVSYQVVLEYTTDVADDSSDVATDISPDQGWTGPVPVTLAPDTVPVTLVPPVKTPGAPDRASAPRPGTTDDAAAPEPPAPARPAAPPSSGTPVAPQQVPARPRPASGAADRTGPSAPLPALARTGAGDRTVRLASFAVGVGLMGVGLLFANRRPAARPVEIRRRPPLSR